MRKGKGRGGKRRDGKGRGRKKRDGEIGGNMSIKEMKMELGNGRKRSGGRRREERKDKLIPKLRRHCNSQVH